MLMLDGPPPLWASSRPRVGNPRYLPSAWHFGQFAAAVAKRYGDRVDDYILWNEPNLPLWLQPQAQLQGQALHAGLAAHLPLHGPRRLPGDQRGRPAVARSSSARSRPPAAS